METMDQAGTVAADFYYHPRSQLPSKEDYKEGFPSPNAERYSAYLRDHGLDEYGCSKRLPCPKELKLYHIVETRLFNGHVLSISLMAFHKARQTSTQSDLMSLLALLCKDPGCISCLEAFKRSQALDNSAVQILGRKTLTCTWYSRFSVAMKRRIRRT